MNLADILKDYLEEQDFEVKCRASKRRGYQKIRGFLLVKKKSAEPYPIIIVLLANGKIKVPTDRYPRGRDPFWLHLDASDPDFLEKMLEAVENVT